MAISESFRVTWIETAQGLRGAQRRLFMARTVQSLRPGGPRHAESELGCNRLTLRKGMQELSSGITGCDACCCRGRLRGEERLPRRLDDIRDLVTAQSQTDPRLRTQRLYTRLTAAEVRRHLQRRQGYRTDELPSARTIRRQRNDLGFCLTKVAKCKPKKDPAHRRPLRAAQPDEPRGGSSRRRAAAVAG